MSLNYLDTHKSPSNFSTALSLYVCDMHNFVEHVYIQHLLEERVGKKDCSVVNMTLATTTTPSPKP